jgi:hypothetical protein
MRAIGRVTAPRVPNRRVPQLEDADPLLSVKAANIPLVPSLPEPPGLETAECPVIGLTLDPDPTRSLRTTTTIANQPCAKQAPSV